MKKRIISLVLVVVMLLSFLCSCTYNYANKDLTKYASFNASEFEKALLALVIDDGDFGINEDTRKIKVLDTIFAALASDAGTDNKLYDVATGKYDVLYYGYYITVSIETEKEVDGEKVKETNEYTVFTDAMNPAKPGSLQFGLLDTEGLAKLIEELVGDKNIGDYVFKATTDGKTEGGDKINLSYTKTWSVPKLDADGNPELDAEGKPLYESKTETVNYGVVTLPVVEVEEDKTEGDDDQTATVDETTDGGETGEGENNTTETETTKLPFLQYLIGQKVGKVGDGKYEGVKEIIDGVEYEVSYSSVNINWIIEDEGTEIGTVEDKTYTSSKKVKDVNGVEVELKDQTLVYHIFPMYVVDVVDELTPEVVLKKILGTDTDKDGTVEDSEKGSLELFTSEEYKNGEETLKALIEKLVTAYNDLAKAEKALVTAEAKAKTEAEKNESSEAKPASEENNESTEGENNESTTEGENNESTEGENTETAPEKTDLEKAQDEVAAKQTAVDELVAKIVAASNGEKTVADVIVEEYTDAVYDNLEASYISTIKTNISKEIFKLAEKYITYGDKLPKAAVKQAYERIENVHKYNFYQGNYTNADKTTVSNYVKYEGNYENYLKVTLGLKTTDSMDACKEKMTKQAEDAVKELILVYTLADVYGDAVELTKEQKKSVKNNIYVIYLGVAEEDVLHAMQWDNIINHILEEGEEVEGDNKVKFVRVEYTFTPEETEEEDSASDAE